MPGIASENGSIAYDVIDLLPPWIQSPETVILHHGVGTHSAMWAEWLPILASRFRIVCFDMRGFGDSDAPGPGFTWTLDSFAADVIAVADASATQRFHLIGESFGGTVTLYTAIAHPSRLLSATCISAPHRGNSIQVLRGWKDLVATRSGMAAWSRDLMAYRFYDGAVASAAHAWFKAVQDRTPPDVVVRVSQLVQETDLRSRLDQVSAPVLLLASDSSPFVESELVAELHGMLKASEMQVFAHTRHGLAFSHARQCAELFVDFSARVRTGGLRQDVAG